MHKHIQEENCYKMNSPVVLSFQQTEHLLKSAKKMSGNSLKKIEWMMQSKYQHKLQKNVPRCYYPL